MKTDVRQLLALVEESGYAVTGVIRPQSRENRYIASEYEFVRGSYELTLTFTIDPLPGYLSGLKKARRSVKKDPLPDEVRITRVDTRNNQQEQQVFSLRNSDPEKIRRFICFAKFD